MTGDFISSGNKFTLEAYIVKRNDKKILSVTISEAKNGDAKASPF